MFNIRMKPVSKLKIHEFITNVENLLRVSAKFCYHFQGGVIQIILFFYILTYFKP